ncbi:FecR family protein [Pedobacter fastidiosus]|uniref:FecR domain-containing protein n=1 Tax=Pedobacter fastidiosus TaxID=2765361 RepID=A0ABR7KWH9_9SPHI|nr:FecR domain-containing protein [Pedobacter fastidiosus]MBC6112466.1 FecR domain-containing protein [Pedobacter fastidiosus]
MENFDPTKGESFYIQLIFDEMEGNISQHETEQLIVWRKQDPANEKTYREMVENADNLELLKIYRQLDTEISITSLHQKLRAGQNIDKPENRKNLSLVYLRWVGAAAVLFLFIFSSIYIFQQQDRVVLSSTHTETARFTLPDGSKIVLNANSSIAYSKRSFHRSRAVKLLNGECFLAIVHNPNKPFSISYGNISVRDIGTSFNFGIDGEQLKVSVRSGIISIHENRSEISKAILKAGETATYQTKTGHMHRDSIRDLNYMAYVDHHLVFNNASLNEVAKSLELAYHRKIRILGSLTLKRHFTAEFKDRSLSDVLSVICVALNLEFLEKAGIIYLQEKRKQVRTNGS